MKNATVRDQQMQMPALFLSCSRDFSWSCSALSRALRMSN